MAPQPQYGSACSRMSIPVHATIFFHHCCNHHHSGNPWVASQQHGYLRTQPDRRPTEDSVCFRRIPSAREQQKLQNTPQPPPPQQPTSSLLPPPIVIGRNYPPSRLSTMTNGQTNEYKFSKFSVTYATHGHGTGFLHGPGWVLIPNYPPQYSLLGPWLCCMDTGLPLWGIVRCSHWDSAYPACPSIPCVVPSLYIVSTYSPQMHVLPWDQVSRVKQSSLQISCCLCRRKPSPQQCKVVLLLLLRGRVAVESPKLISLLLHSQVAVRLLAKQIQQLQQPSLLSYPH
jgi:hypothetical protein